MTEAGGAAGDLLCSALTAALALPFSAAALLALRLRRSLAFETYVTTLGFGLGLYLADVVSDVVNAVLLYRGGHVWWSGETIGLVFLPGLVRGTYELFRSPIIYEATSSSFTLKKQRRRNQLLSSDASIFRKTLNRLPESLSLGLDVLPRASLPMPGNGVGTSDFRAFLAVVATLLAMVVYVPVMALWFPMLPLIQYAKVLSIQLKMMSLGEGSLHFDLMLETVTGETMRAVHFKATETLLEAAPQLFLQLYITYRRSPEDNIIPALISMTLSLLSLLKTSHDLQEVDRVQRAVSYPGSMLGYFLTSQFWFATTIVFRSYPGSMLGYFLTSQFWFATTIVFRSLALSMTALYLNGNKPYRSCMAIYIVILIFGNILLRYFLSASGAILYGVMSSVAPARFICVKPSRNTESLTRKYLAAYVIFNSLAHLSCASIVLAIFYPTTKFDGMRVSQEIIMEAGIPAGLFTGFLSILSAFMHWKLSLLHLFRAKSRYPKFAKLETRLKTFPKTSSGKMDNYNPEDLASSGFFCRTPGKLLPLTCYDCGLVLRGGLNDSNDINVLHAAALLRYVVAYRYRTARVGGAGHKNNANKSSRRSVRSKTFNTLGNPDLVREAVSKLIAVKPQCHELEDKQIDFKKFAIRLRSHFHGPSELSEGGPVELASAGFVGTSHSTVACFSCYAHLDLSDHRARTQSPWALHAWSKEGFDCQFLKKCLSEYDFRLKTYPKEWFSNRGSHAPKPEELASAGFYCGHWSRGRGWVKCHACNAYLYQWPLFNQQQQQRRREDPPESQRLLSRKLSKKSKSRDQQWQNMLLFAEEAASTRSEIPGVSYFNPLNVGKPELPLVSHYSQNINCWFVQKLLEDPQERLKTFPEGWSEANDLSVTASEVANAGFVHFPSAAATATDGGEVEVNESHPAKVTAHSRQRVDCTVSRCPRCLLTVNWKSPRHLHLKPWQVRHLPACTAKGAVRGALMKSIQNRTRMRRERDGENSDDGEDEERESCV